MAPIGITEKELKQIKGKLQEWTNAQTKKSSRKTNTKTKKTAKIRKKVKVIASKNDNTDIWTEGQFDTVEEAINYLDKIDTSNVTYNVYSDSNRVIYTKQGGVSA